MSREVTKQTSAISNALVILKFRIETTPTEFLRRLTRDEFCALSASRGSLTLVRGYLNATSAFKLSVITSAWGLLRGFAHLCYRTRGGRRRYGHPALHGRSSSYTSRTAS